MKATPEQLDRIRAWQKANPDKCLAASRRYYERNREVVRARLREWKRTHKPEIAAEQRRRRRKNRDKFRARAKVASALQAGQLVKPATCEECDQAAQHAHHEDYSRPLDVRWLCVSCHSLVHSTLDPRVTQSSDYHRAF